MYNPEEAETVVLPIIRDTREEAESTPFVDDYTDALTIIKSYN